MQLPHRAAWLGLACVVLASAAVGLDDRLGALVFNTALLVAGTLAISLPLGTAAAVLIARTDVAGRRLAAAGLGAVLFVPIYLQAAAWQAGFGLQGWVTLNWDIGVWLEGMTAAVWIHGLAATPWVALIVGIGLQLVEPELEEQAVLDASPGYVFRQVTFPACYGAIGVAALWVAVTTSAEMAVTDLFAVRTFAEEIYTQTAMGPQTVDGVFVGPPGFAACLLASTAMVLAGMILLLSLSTARRPPSRRRLVNYSLGRFRFAASTGLGVLLFIVIGVPLVNLAVKAGIVVSQTDNGRVREWFLSKFVEVVVSSPWKYGEEFGWTLLIGLLAATAAATLGAMLAWLTCRGRVSQTLVWVLIAAALATPGPVIGLAVIQLVNRPGIPLLTFLYNQSIFAPWLAQTIRALPAGTLIMWFAFRSISPSVLDAARVDGAGRWSQLTKIALPMRWSAWCLAWVACAVVAAGDLGASVLTVPPGVMTLQIQIFTLLHYGVEDVVAGISLASALGFAAVTLLVGGWGQRYLRRK